MPSDSEAASLRTAQPSWGISLILLFLTGCLLLVNRSAPLARNLSDLTLIHGLCWEESCAALNDGRLMLRSGANLDATLRDQASPCQQIWVSRLGMAESVQAAMSALADVDQCPRKDLATAWQAQLAWNVGDQEKAKEQWSKLPPSTLSGWGYQLLLLGDVSQGRFVLDTALSGSGSSISAGQRYQLLMNLGHSYRLERSWERAAEYYREAQSLASENIEVAFFLGMSLRESGANAEAVDVLNHGLSFLSTDRPYFVSSYYLQLGLAYKGLGQADRAVVNMQKAKEWELRESRPNQEQIKFIESEIAGTKQTDD